MISGCELLLLGRGSDGGEGQLAVVLELGERLISPRLSSTANACIAGSCSPEVAGDAELKVGKVGNDA